MCDKRQGPCTYCHRFTTSSMHALRNETPGYHMLTYIAHADLHLYVFQQGHVVKHDALFTIYTEKA